MAAFVQTTNYGFQFGAARVERLASHKNYVVVGVTTPKQMLHITITPTGLIRLGVPMKNQSARIEK